MGVSTDGQICYGILFDEDYEFPWASTRHEDEEEWWREVTGFNPSFRPFTKEGDFANGITREDPRIDVFFDEQRAWDQEHPLPVKLVNVCSDNVPQYILATPSSYKTASRGYPESFNPSDLVVVSNEEKALLEFCSRFKIEYKEGPRWYLSSYWG